MQRENTFLRAQFAQKTDALSKEKIELEKKLSASEVEVQLIRESLKVTLHKHSEEGKKQEERVSRRVDGSLIHKGVGSQPSLPTA